MTNTKFSSHELERDKTVTRALHHLFWDAMTHTKFYFIITALCYSPSFFINQIFVPLQIAYGIQAIIKHQYSLVGHYAIYILILTLIGQLIYALATWAFNRNGVYGAGYVQKNVYANYLSKDYEFYSSSYIGSLGSNATRLGDAFAGYNRLALFEIPRNAVIVITGLAVIAIKSLPLALITLGCISLVVGITVIYSGYRLKYRRIVSLTNSRLSAVLGDALSHAPAVKSFAKENYEINRMLKPLREWQVAQLKSWDLFTPGNFVRNMLLAVTVAILLIVSSRLYQENRITIAIIALVQLYVIRIINVTIDSAEMIKEYETIMSNSYDAVATMLTPRSVLDPLKPAKLKINENITVNFSAVRYRYPDVNENVFAVNNFNLSVKSGEKIGLVGYSGSGKTTLTKLLLRFMDVSEGEVLLNDTNIKDVKQEDLRNLIAYVPQDPVLFHRTIKENIAYGDPNASNKDILEAARSAYVDEFIDELPNKYDSMVGERGVKLSGGQRQRVAIARAFLKNARILILDEATSSLDSKSEQYIQKALWDLMENKTAIVIAHRLSTIQKMDRIVVMDKGKISQIGSHDKLLEDQNSIYARLWARQSGGYLVEN